jgi:hypothetical protein
MLGLSALRIQRSTFVTPPCSGSRNGFRSLQPRSPPVAEAGTAFVPSCLRSPHVAEAGTAFVPCPPCCQHTAVSSFPEMQCNFLPGSTRTVIAVRLPHYGPNRPSCNPISLSGTCCSPLEASEPSSPVFRLERFISDLRRESLNEYPPRTTASPPRPVDFEVGTAAEHLRLWPGDLASRAVHSRTPG